MKKYMLLLCALAVFAGAGILFFGCATQQESVKEEVSESEEKTAPEQESKQQPEEQKDVEIVQRVDLDGDGVIDDVDKCAATPEGAIVDESGCPKDSDNDGVYDGLDRCPETVSGVPVDGNGCPVAGPSGRTGRYKVVMEFESNSASVRSSYYTMYGDQVEKIRRQNPYLEILRVEVYGHSDNTGSMEYNMGLSERRARSVSRFISSQFGIDPKVIETAAYGESKPLESNRSRGGRQKNRRVEVYLTLKNLDN